MSVVIAYFHSFKPFVQKDTHHEYANILFPFGPLLQYCTVPLLFGNLFTEVTWILITN